MSEEQYSERILCSSAGVELQRFKNEYLTQDELHRLVVLRDIQDSYKFEIDDSGSPHSARNALEADAS